MTRRFGPSGIGLAIIAIVMAVQFWLLGNIIAAQGDVAHVIDVGELQRMRTQRIAFIVTTAHLRQPERNWRAELERTTAAMIATRAEMTRNAEFRTGPVGSDGLTALGRLAERYVDAARQIDRNPKSTIAYRTVRNLRVPMLDGIRRAVGLRAARIADRNHSIAMAIVAGLLVELVAICIVWLRIVRPAERRVEKMVEALATQRSEMLSIFRDTPDSLAMYDLQGRLTKANASRVAMFGFADESDVVGRHFSEFLPPNESESVATAFARAIGGEAMSGATHFVRSKGDIIDVNFRLFPQIVDGRTTGVISVTRDITEINRQRRLVDQMASRMKALYDVASAGSGTWREHVDAALAIVAEPLDSRWGYVNEVLGEEIEVLSSFGKVAIMNVALRGSFSQAVLGDQSLLDIPDIVASAWSNHSRVSEGWRSVAVARIDIDATRVGTMILAGSQARPALDDGDREFLKIAARLFGGEIARGREHDKLDHLAYFDALTGLANRSALVDHLNETVALARHRSSEFAVHFIDLDGFKDINDSLGHAAGDHTLCTVASRIRAAVRSDDFVARLGGDEFVLVQVGGMASARSLAAEISQSLAIPIDFAGQSRRIGCSIGTSVFPIDGTDSQTLMRRADERMYRAKTAKTRSVTA